MEYGDQVFIVAAAITRNCHTIAAELSLTGSSCTSYSCASICLCRYSPNSTWLISQHAHCRLLSFSSAYFRFDLDYLHSERRRQRFLGDNRRIMILTLCTTKYNKRSVRKKQLLDCLLLMSERRTCAYAACRACRVVRVAPCCPTSATQSRHVTSPLFPIPKCID